MGLHQIKKLHSKENNDQCEQTAHKMGSSSHRELISEIYKDLKKLNTKSTNNPIYNGQLNSIDTFQKRKYKQPINTRKNVQYPQSTMKHKSKLH
jgi:hypothetical protein